MPSCAVDRLCQQVLQGLLSLSLAFHYYLSTKIRYNLQLIKITILQSSLEIIFGDLPVKMTSTNEFVPVMKQKRTGHFIRLPKT